MGAEFPAGGHVCCHLPFAAGAFKEARAWEGAGGEEEAMNNIRFRSLIDPGGSSVEVASPGERAAG